MIHTEMDGIKYKDYTICALPRKLDVFNLIIRIPWNFVQVNVCLIYLRQKLSCCAENVYFWVFEWVH